MRTLSRKEAAIAREDDVALVRQEVRAAAERCGFNAFAVAAVTTAASELGRNAWIHAGGGRATIEEIETERRVGVRLTIHDTGPGIPDVERVLRGGYSTARSLGLGVAGSRRLVDDLRIESTVGAGTTVVVTKWKRGP